MKLLLAPVLFFVLVSFCKAQSTPPPSLLLVKSSYKYAPANRFAYQKDNNLNLNNGNVAYKFSNMNGKFTLHPVTKRPLIPYPNLTFLKGTKLIKTGTLHYRQGVRLDKYNFLYFNLSF